MVEEIEFNNVNLVHTVDAFNMIHRDAMRGVPNGLWPRVAFAATVIAERGIDALLAALEAERDSDG